MSYQVLARKWRPKKFASMVGQEHILRMLSNALEKQRLHHAYLFTGTRGVGKTSLARLLAKCLNCETGITAQPCDTCTACVAIDSGRFIDLIEVDAASKTKVEDTRELLENIQYPPNGGRFKIYLIDEVHMLSGHSFNALLKTLEEPPEHVKFLLATTDPKRLPITILSRCLQFNLKRVPHELISQQLQKICEAETVSFAAAALDQLALAADGSMRDALSLLDQAIAFGKENITLIDVRNMLGNVEESLLINLLQALADNNPAQVFSELQALEEMTPDYDRVLEDLLTLLQLLARKQIAKLATHHPELDKLAKKLSAEDVQLFYQVALIGRKDLPFAPTPALGFEMILLRMLAFHPGTKTSVSPSNTKVAEKQSKTIVNEKKSIPTTTATDANAPFNWEKTLPQLGLTGMTQALAANCAFESITEQELVLSLEKKHEPLLNVKSCERLQAALQKCLNKSLTVKINLTQENLTTVAKKTEATQKSKLASAVQALHTDQQVQQMVDLFGATVDVTSIKPVES